MINANATVSIKDANDDFSNVTSVVDKLGRAVILQNEMPKYLVIELNSANDKDEYVSTEEAMRVSNEYMIKNREAYEALAKWED